MPWKQMRTWFVDTRNPQIMHHSIKDLYQAIEEERPESGSKLPEFIYAVNAMNAEIARKKLVKAGILCKG